VYEIVAQSEPFKDMDILEVAVLIRDKGLTPQIPANCPRLLHEVMELCWNIDPDKRPTFEAICDMFQRSLDATNTNA
jgi:hypothetical protein